MPVSYDGNLIIPAPLAEVRKEYQRTEDGAKIGTVWSIVLKGKISVSKGSPNAAGVFWTSGGGTYPNDETDTSSTNRLGKILRKQEALRNLFKNDGKLLEINPIYPDSSAPAKFYPKVKDINFADGLWVEVCDYTITLEADTMYGIAQEEALTTFISRADESWSLEPADDIGRTFKLNHSVSASGKRIFSNSGDGSLLNGKEAWQNAKDWVAARLGIDDTKMQSSVVGTTTASAFNYLRSENTNVKAGTYAVTETWLVFDTTGLSAPAIEEYTVTTRTDETGRSRASIEGNIRGLEVRNNTTHGTPSSTRYQNALSYWNSISGSIFSRVAAASSVTLNPSALGTSVGKNTTTGVINFNYEYNDRPSSEISGSISENISVSTDNKADIVAQVVVLGRSLGPVVQDIETRTAARKTLTIEAQMTPATYSNPNATEPNTDALVATYTPSGTTVWLEKDTPTWNKTQGRYSRVTTWGYI